LVFWAPLRIGSTALELATSSIPVLLISQRVAAKLASGEAKGITVLVSTADREKKLEEIRSLLRAQGDPSVTACGGPSGAVRAVASHMLLIS